VGGTGNGNNNGNGKSKNEIQGFFPFSKLRVRMTSKTDERSE
jgi:hypothetical protein